MEMQNQKIYITTEDGKELEGEILFTFDANGDDFVFYVLEGSEEVNVSKVNEEGALSPVEEDEWKLLEKVFEEYQEDMEKAENDNK